MSCKFVVFGLFAPHWEMTCTTHVAAWEAEEFEGGEHEFSLGLDGAEELGIVGGVVLKELPWLHQSKIRKPLLHQLLNSGSV